MERKPGSQRRPGTLSTSPLGSKKEGLRLHALHASTRHGARHHFWTGRSGCLSVVVTLPPTQSFPPRHATRCEAHFFPWFNQSIAGPRAAVWIRSKRKMAPKIGRKGAAAASDWHFLSTVQYFIVVRPNAAPNAAFVSLRN